MAAEIVWFFGQSGAGKKTFIEALGRDVGLYDLVAVAPPIRIIRESIEWVESPEMPEKRKRLLDIIEAAVKAEPGTSIVVKGQDPDLINELPLHICDRLPANRHRIVFVTSKGDEVYRRWQLRRWPHERAAVDRELKGQMEHMRRLAGHDFLISGLDATGPEYRNVTLTFLEN